MPDLRAHALLSALFLVSRYLVDLAGIRLNLVLDWMVLSDPADLRDHLLQTVYYAHAFPPGLNVITGVLLKLGGSNAVAGGHALLQLCGLVVANALLHMGRALGMPLIGAFALALLFSLTPPVIYFEHLHHHEGFVVALLCTAAVLFYRGVKTTSFWAWFACFLSCALIGWIRSSFHLVWFVAVIGLGLWFARAGTRGRLLAAAGGPAAVLLALYLKNFLVFGVFGALTFGPHTFTTVTIRNMPADLREEWVRQGKLSPFANHNVHEPPRNYLPYFTSSEDPRWPPMLNALERPSNGTGNFNHWFFLKINPRRRSDTATYLQARPAEYAASVLANVVEFFSPATTWHPSDKTEQSPHHKHRQVLGAYEAAYNRVAHGLPWAPVGLHVFVPIAFVWALLRLRFLSRSAGANERGAAALLAFCLMQIAYITVTGVMLAFGEASRYRFQVDSFIWLVMGLAVASLWAKVRNR